MKSPVSQEQQSTVDPLLRIKKRVACLQKKIKKIEDPESYVQEIVAEKRDKFLSNALARFERRQAQRNERKEDEKQEVVAEKKTQKRQKVEKNVTAVEDCGGKTTEQSEFVADAPLKQMVVEEEEVKEPKVVPSLLSYHSKAITKTAPTSLLRRPGPQPPVPSLLTGSRLLK